jgi:hypothetical protein
MENLRKYLDKKNIVSRLWGHHFYNINRLTESDIKELNEMIETELSPEIISCDGERSGVQIAETKAYLQAVQNELIELNSRMVEQK